MIYKMPFVIEDIHYNQMDATDLGIIIGNHGKIDLLNTEMDFYSYEYISKEKTRFIHIDFSLHNLRLKKCDYKISTKLNMKDMWNTLVKILLDMNYIIIGVDCAKIKSFTKEHGEFWPGTITLYGFDEEKLMFEYAGFQDGRKYSVGFICLDELYKAWTSLLIHEDEIDSGLCVNNELFRLTLIKYKNDDCDIELKEYKIDDKDKSNVILYYSQKSPGQNRRLYTTPIVRRDEGLQVITRIKFFIKQSLKTNNYDYCMQLPNAIRTYAIWIIQKKTLLLQKNGREQIMRFAEMSNQIKEYCNLLLVYGLKYDFCKKEVTLLKLEMLIEKIIQILFAIEKVY